MDNMPNATQHRLCTICKQRHAGVAHIWGDPVDTNIGQAQKVERRSPKPKASGSIPETGANNLKPVAHRLERQAKRDEGTKQLEGNVQPNGAAQNFPSQPERTVGSIPQQGAKRGRPRIHLDRKAYKAEHERNRRAKKKEGK